MSDRLAVIACAYASGALTVIGIAGKNLIVIGLPSNLIIISLSVVSLAIAILCSTEKNK